MACVCQTCCGDTRIQWPLMHQNIQSTCMYERLLGRTLRYSKHVEVQFLGSASLLAARWDSTSGRHDTKTL